MCYILEWIVEYSHMLSAGVKRGGNWEVLTIAMHQFVCACFGVKITSNKR